MSDSLKSLMLDEFNRHYFIELSAAHTPEELGAMLRVATRHPLWNGKLAKHACQVLVLLTGKDV